MSESLNVSIQDENDALFERKIQFTGDGIQQQQRLAPGCIDLSPFDL